jgi:hypothetical protein
MGECTEARQQQLPRQRRPERPDDERGAARVTPAGDGRQTQAERGEVDDGHRVDDRDRDEAEVRRCGIAIA